MSVMMLNDILNEHDLQEFQFGLFHIILNLSVCDFKLASNTIYTTAINPSTFQSLA